MSDKLPCAAVRDLLPLYAEGLTEEETKRLIEAHLSTCPDCKKRYDALCAPDAPVQERQEVDYLKAVRRKNRRKIWLSAVAALGATLAGALIFLFCIGFAAGPDDLNVTLTEADGEFTLDISAPWSAMAIGKTGLSVKDGVAELKARTVLVSPLCHEGDDALYLPSDGIKEVVFAGRTLWKDGLTVSPKMQQLAEAAAPYVGSASDTGRVLSLVPRPDKEVQMQLLTDAEPYGVALNYAEPLTEKETDLLRRSAALVLASIGNAKRVVIADPNGVRAEVREEDFDLSALCSAYNQSRGTAFALPGTLKACGGSAFDLQLLSEVLGLAKTN